MPEQAQIDTEDGLETCFGHQTVSEHPKKPCRRKITPYDVARMAEHFRDGCNDKEACNLEGINPLSWYNWKSKKRNQTDFDDVLSRLRADRKKGAFRRIELCADGVGMKQPDWRAAEALLRLTDPQQFDPQRQNVVVNVGIQASIEINDIATRLYAQRSRHAVVDTQAKLITDKPAS